MTSIAYAGETVVVVRWPHGTKKPEMRVHASVLNAVVVLLTYGAPGGVESPAFKELCAMWFDPVSRPKVFSTKVDASSSGQEREEEVPLFPDWLAMKMLRFENDFVCRQTCQ